MKLGRKASLGQPNAAAPPVASSPAVKRVDIASLRFGTRRGLAEQALTAAQSTARGTKWRDAATHFDSAIRLATNPNFRLRACEEAADLYERAGSVEPLLDVYRYIVVSCRTPQEAKQVRTQLFSALKNIASGDETWNSRLRSDEPFQWPISMSRAIADTFEPQLVKTPDHEPTLLVLQFFYDSVHQDPKKQLFVLLQLDKALQQRGESLDRHVGAQLAELLVRSGKPKEAAILLDRLAGREYGIQAAALRQLEGDAWADAGDRAKALAALGESMKLWEEMRTHGRINEYVKIADTYMKLGEKDQAVELYQRAIVGQASEYSVEQLQAKLAAAVGNRLPSNGDTADAAKPNESMDELLDPKRKFQVTAQQAETLAKGPPSTIVTSMISAAENWLQAGENDRAVAALHKAVIANRRTGSLSTYNYSKIATLFADAGANQLAAEQWILALQKSTSSSAITRHQAELDALIQADPSLTIDPKHQSLLDPKYVFRVQAITAEKSRTSDAYSRAGNLMHAARYWLQAEEKSEAHRCVVAAEKVMGAATPSKTDSRRETYLRQLADTFGQLEMPDEEVRCLTAALELCSSDAMAQRDFERIKLICQTHSLPEPKLDPDVAKKLDPLNRYREQAVKYEQQAKENASSASTYYNMAISSWIRAEETEKAGRVANTWARLVLKDKSDRNFERTIGQLGDVYVKLDRLDTAKKCYEEQLKATTSESRKRYVQRKIDQLSE